MHDLICHICLNPLDVQNFDSYIGLCENNDHYYFLYINYNSINESYHINNYFIENSIPINSFEFLHKTFIKGSSIIKVFEGNGYILPSIL